MGGPGSGRHGNGFSGKAYKIYKNWRKGKNYPPINRAGNRSSRSYLAQQARNLSKYK